MDAAGLDLERDILQRRHARETLFDAAELQNVILCPLHGCDGLVVVRLGDLCLRLEDLMHRRDGLICKHGHEHAQTLDDIVPEHGNVDHINAQRDGAHQQTSEECAPNRADAAKQACTAEHHGRDDRKFQALTCQRLRRTGAANGNDRRNATQDARDEVGKENEAVGIDTGCVRGSRVAADGIELHAEAQILHCPQAEQNKRHEHTYACRNDDRAKRPLAVAEPFEDLVGDHDAHAVHDE